MKFKGICLSVGIHASLFFLASQVDVHQSPPKPTPIQVRMATLLSEPEPDELVQPAEPVQPAPSSKPAPPETPAPTPAERQVNKPPSKPADLKKSKKSKQEAPVPDKTPPKKPMVKLNTVLSNASTGSTVSSGDREVGALHAGQANGGPVAGSKRTGGSSNAGKADACRERASQPQPIKKTTIPYPKRAREEGVQGQLVLGLWVDEQGFVTQVKVLRSLSTYLDSQAIQAVRSWKFRPARACGKAVPGQFTLARRFELGG